MRASSSIGGSGGAGRATAPTVNGRQGINVAAVPGQAGPAMQQSSSNFKTNSPARLVFGLSPKTNKLKHDEYAEKRGAAKVQSSLRASIQDSSNPAKTMNENGSPVADQQLTQSTKTVASPKQSANRNGSLGKRQRENSFAGKLTNEVDAAPSVNNQKGSLAAESALIFEPNRKNRSTSPATTRSGKQRSKSPEVSSEAATGSARRRVEVPIGAGSAEAERSVTKTLLSDQSAEKSSSHKRSTVSIKEGSDTAPKRMQFNIPPPPLMSSGSSSRKGSVVSYAKSRIYDKPAKQHNSNSTRLDLQLGARSSLLVGHMLTDSEATIPESILSGFKPPKQVNVSKAREKWEGGEPFAKCKSRQRLAAQKAGKKLQLHGTWSMTSVVATQQLQLQQALANSSSPVRSNLERSDPSVKILTRGSVLERVQQFEKAPASPVSSDLDIDDELSNGQQDETNLINGTAGSRGGDSTPAATASKQTQYKNRISSIQNATSTGGNSVGMVQQTITDTPSSLVGLASSRNTITRQMATGGNGAGAARRLSLRRRSSTTSNSNPIIPRFYHPNGRPNTYEIELQKKNIVACFDKLPDKRALLTAPVHKRHFSAIAIACGFSEYFKEPLFLYIKHQLTQSNLLHNPSNSAPMIRKQSGLAAMISNGVSNSGIEQQSTVVSKPALSRRQSLGETKPLLSRSATIDNSTMEKIQNQTYISCEQFLVCWRHLISTCFDNPARFVHLLTFGKRNYLMPDDFVPLVQSIIEDHPGLKFLRAAPDFHMRYIQTVIARIYFCINRSWTGKITLSELRQSNLLAVLQVLGLEEDINQITDYFSYEHFYVIYCRFWSLDQDHDLLISKEDLARHNDAAISSRIIERIFMGIVSRHIQQTGKMSYSDFVWFLIAEEDKKHPRSIEYWFRLMDIDGDGYISMYEMEYFYYEQMKRLELMNIEALPFIDSACQILDLVNPKEKNKISLSDLKRSKMATIFFDTFINLEKYLEHESREFVSTRDCVQDGVVISDWDRYASEEYESLVAEESSV